MIQSTDLTTYGSLSIDHRDISLQLTEKKVEKLLVQLVRDAGILITAGMINAETLFLLPLSGKQNIKTNLINCAIITPIMLLPLLMTQIWHSCKKSEIEEEITALKEQEPKELPSQMIMCQKIEYLKKQILNELGLAVISGVCVLINCVINFVVVSLNSFEDKEGGSYTNIIIMTTLFIVFLSQVNYCMGSAMRWKTYQKKIIKLQALQ
jgi:hypothetical protein